MARPDVSAERKTQILDTAAVVFAQHGFHQARIDDIVKASGLSKGAIYWYFKSKDDIIFALVQRVFDQEMHALHALLDQPGTVRERLMSYIEHVVPTAHALAESGTVPLFYECYVLAMRQEEVRAAIRGYLDMTCATLVPLIEQGIASGEFRLHDAYTSALAFTAQIEGSMLLWAVGPEAINLNTHFPAFMHMLLDGLKPGGAIP
jgi:AcrR family transcriptional regulator